MGASTPVLSPTLLHHQVPLSQRHHASPPCSPSQHGSAQPRSAAAELPDAPVFPAVSCGTQHGAGMLSSKTSSLATLLSSTLESMKAYKVASSHAASHAASAVYSNLSAATQHHQPSRKKPLDLSDRAHSPGVPAPYYALAAAPVASPFPLASADALQQCAEPTLFGVPPPAPSGPSDGYREGTLARGGPDAQRSPTDTAVGAGGAVNKPLLRPASAAASVGPLLSPAAVEPPAASQLPPSSADAQAPGAFFPPEDPVIAQLSGRGAASQSQRPQDPVDDAAALAALVPKGPGSPPTLPIIRSLRTQRVGSPVIVSVEQFSLRSAAKILTVEATETAADVRQLQPHQPLHGTNTSCSFFQERNATAELCSEVASRPVPFTHPAPPLCEEAASASVIQSDSHHSPSHPSPPQHECRLSSASVVAGENAADGLDFHDHADSGPLESGGPGVGVRSRYGSRKKHRRDHQRMSPLTCATRVADELPEGLYEYPKLQFSSVKGEYRVRFTLDGKRRERSFSTKVRGNAYAQAAATSLLRLIETRCGSSGTATAGEAAAARSAVTDDGSKKEASVDDASAAASAEAADSALSVETAADDSNAFLPPPPIPRSGKRTRRPSTRFPDCHSEEWEASPLPQRSPRKSEEPESKRGASKRAALHSAHHDPHSTGTEAKTARPQRGSDAFSCSPHFVPPPAWASCGADLRGQSLSEPSSSSRTDLWNRFNATAVVSEEPLSDPAVFERASLPAQMAYLLQTPTDGSGFPDSAAATGRGHSASANALQIKFDRDAAAPGRCYQGGSLGAAVAARATLPSAANGAVDPDAEASAPGSFAGVPQPGWVKKPLTKAPVPAYDVRRQDTTAEATAVYAKRKPLTAGSLLLLPPAPRSASAAAERGAGSPPREPGPKATGRCAEPAEPVAITLSVPPAAPSPVTHDRSSSRGTAAAETAPATGRSAAAASRQTQRRGAFEPGRSYVSRLHEADREVLDCYEQLEDVLAVLKSLHEDAASSPAAEDDALPGEGSAPEDHNAADPGAASAPRPSRAGSAKQKASRLLTSSAQKRLRHDLSHAAQQSSGKEYNPFVRHPGFRNQPPSDGYCRCVPGLSVTEMHKLRKASTTMLRSQGLQGKKGLASRNQRRPRVEFQSEGPAWIVSAPYLDWIRRRPGVTECVVPVTDLSAETLSETFTSGLLYLLESQRYRRLTSMCLEEEGGWSVLQR